MKKFFLLLLALFAVATARIEAQSPYEKMSRKSRTKVAVMDFRSERGYEKLRDKANAEYAAMLEKAWERCEALGAKPLPKEEEIVPPVVVTPEEDRDRGVIEDRVIPVEEIITPVAPKPQPVPLSPIEEEPVQEDASGCFCFTFFNTELGVRLGEEVRFSLDGAGAKEVAGAWSRLSGMCDPLIKDCLSLRREYDFCDWAYLLMLQELSRAYFGGVCDEAILLTAFLYCQSGYTMRLGKAKGSLVLLYASEHEIYGKNYWVKDGQNFYALDCEASSINISQAKFPKESPLSLVISREPDFSFLGGETRLLKSRKYDVQAQVSTNKSLVEFYQTYPPSMLNGDFGTRWAMYANTPLSDEAISSLYPALRGAIEGLSVVEAANRLLNFVQTAFVYEYDDKVWGYDRAFFAEESLFYPYCDCEDRAILFTRLVRDLLGLEAVLVYYPGHLASAVCFPEDVPGDYVSLGGKRYTVCDPTILGVGAPCGVTMAGMDNSKAKVILLD